MLRRADLHESNHQLESRVREIRLPGSEGGAILISRPYPYPANGTPSAVPEEPPYQHASAVAGRTGLPLTGR